MAGRFMEAVARELAVVVGGKTFPTGLEILFILIRKERDNRYSASEELRFPNLVPWCASHLIPAAHIYSDGNVIDRLRSFFLRHLGDPRLQPVKWASVREEAVSIFKQWIAKSDLEFFFNLVEETEGDSKWIYRRKFWEAYLPYIENTWVLLGRDAQKLFQYSLNRYQYEKERRFGRLRGAKADQSAFLLQIGQYVFVEWSSSGSCRVFKLEHCPVRFGQGLCEGTRLRRDNCELIVVHHSSETYSWQSRLARWILEKLGIRPRGSYTVS